MNQYLLIASGLTVLLGLAHSVIGEMLIFTKIRSGEVRIDLAPRKIGIIWASWHLVTVFGLAIAAMLFRLSRPASVAMLHAHFTIAILTAVAIGALFVLYGTRGKHPGWIVLTVIAGLIVLSGAAL